MINFNRKLSGNVIVNVFRCSDLGSDLPQEGRVREGERRGWERGGGGGQREGEEEERGGRGRGREEKVGENRL